MILVLGATGFLGKRVCIQLDVDGRTYIKSSLSMGCDLRDMNQVRALFERVKPSYVINCAAYVGGIQFGLKHQGELFRNNMLMTLNLLEACREFNVKRQVNPISNCAYPAKATFFKEDEFWEGELHESVLAYGFARKASWVGSWAYNNQYGIDVVNLILSNMYGPDDHFEEERSHALGALVMKFVEAKKHNSEKVIVWGTGNPVREWLYVDDGARAMIKALDIEPYEKPLNVGIGKGISIHDMALLIKKHVGYEGKIVFDTSKPDGAAYKTVDGTIGKQILNWSPSKNFEEGIIETIGWYTETFTKGV